MAIPKYARAALRTLKLPERFDGSYERAAAAVLDEDPSAVCGRAKDEARRKFHDPKLRKLQAQHAKAWKDLCRFQRSRK